MLLSCEQAHSCIASHVDLILNASFPYWFMSCCPYPVCCISLILYVRLRAGLQQEWNMMELRAIKVCIQNCFPPCSNPALLLYGALTVPCYSALCRAVVQHGCCTEPDGTLLFSMIKGCLAVRMLYGAWRCPAIQHDQGLSFSTDVVRSLTVPCYSAWFRADLQCCQSWVFCQKSRID